MAACVQASSDIPVETDECLRAFPLISRSVVCFGSSKSTDGRKRRAVGNNLISEKVVLALERVFWFR